jgi:hypothetical protein
MVRRLARLSRFRSHEYHSCPVATRSSSRSSRAPLQVLQIPSRPQSTPDQTHRNNLSLHNPSSRSPSGASWSRGVAISSHFRFDYAGSATSYPFPTSLERDTLAASMAPHDPPRRPEFRPLNKRTPIFLGHVSRVVPCLRPDGLLGHRPSTGRHGQRPDSLEHRPEQPPCQMTLGQQEPVVTGVPDQPSARLDEALLETAQRPECRKNDTS